MTKISADTLRRRLRIGAVSGPGRPVPGLRAAATALRDQVFEDIPSYAALPADEENDLRFRLTVGERDRPLLQEIIGAGTLAARQPISTVGEFGVLNSA